MRKEEVGSEYMVGERLDEEHEVELVVCETCGCVSCEGNRVIDGMCGLCLACLLRAEQEELDAIERPISQARVSCQITLEHIRARFASPATPEDIQVAVQAFRDGFKEWDF